MIPIETRLSDYDKEDEDHEDDKDHHEDVCDDHENLHDDHEDDSNIAQRVMNRRRKVINPNVLSSTKTDAEVSRRLTSDPVSQAKKFIDKILISISRIAPNDWLSKKLSDQRRRKKS